MPRFGGMGGAFGHMGGGGKVLAAAAAAGFSPLDLTPALWIDPSDTATMFQSNAGTTAVTDGSACGFAGDKSGTAFNLTSAADDTTRPNWVSTGGFPYLDFTSASSQILLRQATLGLYAAGAVSIFAAVKANPATNAIFCGEGSSASNNPAYLLPRANGSTASTNEMYIRNDANTTITISALPTTPSFWNNTDQVVGITDDGANLIPYINTTAQTTRTYTRSGALTIDRFSLGGWQRAAASNFFTTRVYGLVIVKRVITAGERASLITYLGNKAGLSL